MSKRGTKSKQGRASGALSVVTGTSRPISSNVPLNPKGKKKSKSRNKRKAYINRSEVMVNSNGVMYAKKSISPCALMYLKAICDPFDALVQQMSPCIPDLLDQASYKFSTVQRGTFNIGTLGVGSIQVSPYCFANDQPNIIYTQAGYASTATPVSPAANTANVLNSQFPWPSTAYRSVRTVACGLRVRSICPTVDMSGVSIPFTAVQYGDYTSGVTDAQALDRDEIMWYNNDRTWRGCTYKPMIPTDYQYSNTSFPVSVSTGVNNKLCVICTGKAGVQQAYEVVTFYEAIPLHDSAANRFNTVPGVSKSDSDIEGLSTVRDFLGNVTNSEVGQQLYYKGLDYLKQNAITIAAGALGWH